MNDNVVKREWNLDDWSCEEKKSGESVGFYQQGLIQTELVKKLLMYGHTEYDSIIFSIKSICGLNLESKNSDNIPTKTGLKNIDFKFGKDYYEAK